MINLKLRNPTFFQGTILIYKPHYHELAFECVKSAKGWVLTLNDTHEVTFQSVESVFEFLCNSEAGH